MTTDLDHRIRLAAFQWLDRQVQIHGEELPWSVIAQGFEWQGQRVPLVSQQGIFKPKVLPEIPLSIRTSVSGPYDDQMAASGEMWLYRYRGEDPDHPENAGLRKAWRTRTPLVYFIGLDRGVYFPVWPVFIVGDDPQALTFTVEVDDATVAIPAGTGGDAGASTEEVDWYSVTDAEDDARRAYVTAVCQRRVHQRRFRVRVLHAYRRQCAMCRLRHRELLDAAHIIKDRDPLGLPMVRNGLSLCKLHHAAFDGHLIGVRPDYVVEVRADVLEEEDGPMLLHGLKGMHRIELPVLPRKADEKPDREMLARRYEEFLGAA